MVKESQKNKIGTVHGGDSKTIKSPSDTTIYTPALKQNLVRKSPVNNNHLNGVGDRQVAVEPNGIGCHYSVNEDMIGNFVEAVRIQQQQKELGGTPDVARPGTSAEVM